MIEITNLHKRFRQTEAVAGLSLSVPEGQVTAFLGPNGAGKSTIIKCLLNLHRPDSGHATVIGCDSRRLGPAQFAQIGYVSENMELPLWMPVTQFLNYCRPLYPNWDREFEARLLREFGTQRQVTGLAVLTVVGLGFWLAIQGTLPQPTASLEPRNLAICGSLAGGLCAFIGIMTAWWLLTVPRRRGIGAGLVTGTLVAAPLVAGAWRIDWVTPPTLTYPNSARLTVKTGNADPADSMLGLALWPTLRIGGLGQDEVASIVEFSPVEDGKPWPPETSYTDLDRDGYSDDWLHSDHTRALFKHYPKATLWREEIRNQGLRFGRRTLEEVLQAQRLKREEAIARPWRLRLVVHEMNRVATVPFRQLWTQDHAFLIRPGLRLEYRAINFEGGSYLMRGCAHRVSSAVLPIERHRPVHVRDRDLSAGLFLVLEDGELRENLAGAMSFWPIPHPRGVLDQWQVEESRGTCLNPKLPRGQEAILQRTLDQWIDSQNASFWHAQERGIVDFDLTPEQMAEVIPNPQEKGRK